MERFKRRRKKNTILSIESVAMTDVVFLLLIFFMLSTTFVSLDNGVKIDLPSGGLKNIKVIDEINLKISKDGSVFFHGRKLDEDFDRIVQAALRNSNKKTVIISADKDTRHENVVDVMNKVLKLGAKSIAIATREEIVKEVKN
ncbi:MAG: hypothetical protein C0601_10870 [Candidatus Muiribacterium halophilum]|uniref:Biopolymer transporter ExbD n=1 Tax=Muiribacterium halophilum TaxID=2053465 RepID=A0A2N5ZBS0_MUIH1|nr:MAG: hypothetical protein C0601_10870 [Candidatus Muirbacterium halophilum]